MFIRTGVRSYSLLLQFKQETIIKFPHVGMVAASTCYRNCKAFQIHSKAPPDFVVYQYQCFQCLYLTKLQSSPVEGRLLHRKLIATSERDFI